MITFQWKEIKKEVDIENHILNHNYFISDLYIITTYFLTQLFKRGNFWFTSLTHSSRIFTHLRSTSSAKNMKLNWLTRFVEQQTFDWKWLILKCSVNFLCLSYVGRNTGSFTNRIKYVTSPELVLKLYKYRYSNTFWILIWWEKQVLYAILFTQWLFVL